MNVPAVCQKNFQKLTKTIQKRESERNNPRFTASPLKRKLQRQKEALISYKQTLEQDMSSPDKRGKALSMIEGYKPRGKSSDPLSSKKVYGATSFNINTSSPMKKLNLKKGIAPKTPQPGAGRGQANKGAESTAVAGKI